MSGPLFKSTIDPLLIHLPCPFNKLLKFSFENHKRLEKSSLYEYFFIFHSNSCFLRFGPLGRVIHRVAYPYVYVECCPLPTYFILRRWDDMISAPFNGALGTRRCSGLDLWIVPVWSLKKKEMFCTGIVDCPCVLFRLSPSRALKVGEVFQIGQKCFLNFLTQCYYQHVSRESVSFCLFVFCLQFL